MGWKDFLADWDEVFGLIFWAVIMGGLVPLLALFIGRGAEDVALFDTFKFYGTFGLMFLAGLVALRINEFMVKRNRKLFDGYGWGKAIIHDPEKGAIKLNIKFRTWVFVSLILFSILGIVAVVNNTFFVAIPNVEQQVTETSKVILAAEPAATVETLLFVFIMSLMVGFVDWLRDKKQINPTVAWIIKYTLVIAAFVALWVAFHAVRYGAKETKLIATGFFALVGGVIIITFGTFVPWYIFHLLNNIFVKANELFSNEFTVIVTVLLLIVVVLVFVFVEFRSKKKFEDFQA